MLVLNDVYFAFAKAESDTLSDINLTLGTGEHLAIIGESGCGKSTLLHLIYGLLQERKGSIQFNGEQLLGANNHLVPGHEMMKHVPQEFNLMPYTTVAENVGEFISIQLKDRASRITELLETVELLAFKNVKVKQLSGGQKQRVAIAKALAQQPQLLLLDEPFSHIDNFRKNTLRRKLYNYLNKNKICSIIATHDREDVLGFTGATAVMKSGKIIDHRLTAAVYEQPLNAYCARLFDEVSIIDNKWFNLENPGQSLYYPHQLTVSKSGIKVQVINSYFKGSHYLIEALLKERRIYFNHPVALDTNDMILISKQ